jgi:hypothetical protein
VAELVRKSALPLYVALIVSVPAASVEVVMPAVPPLSDFDPRLFVPDLKVTEPVGVPDVEDITVAVKVTAVPPADGFTDEVNAVLVAALVTVWDIAGDVLVVSFASPL